MIIMARKRTPQDKNRPRLKAVARRSYRRAVRLELNSDIASLEDAAVKAAAVQVKKRGRVGATPLGEVVRQKQERLVRTAGYNYFKVPYSRTQHRDKFTAFLRSLVHGRGVRNREVARLFREMLDYPQLRAAAKITTWAWRHHEWLKAFLRDRPT
jgi:hypothetical protein